MNRKDYDAKVIGVFDTIGSYFVDVFYNNHYLLAKDTVKQGRANSITDAYRENILNYMNGIATRDDLYKKVVYQLHAFYQRHSGFNSILISDFQDKVLGQFIPQEYYRDFTEKHKDKTLREIIIRTANEFGEMVVGKDILRRIIDDHMSRANIITLQDRVCEIFMLQREDYYARFANEISQRNGGDKVNKKVIDKLKQAFVDEKKKRIELEADRERALHIVKQLMKKIQQLESSVKKDQPAAVNSGALSVIGELSADSAKAGRRRRSRHAETKFENYINEDKPSVNPISMLTNDTLESTSDSIFTNTDSDEEPDNSPDRKTYTLDDDPWNAE